MRQFMFRFRVELIARVDKHLKWIAKYRPGLSETRSSLIRRYIQEGIERDEQVSREFTKLKKEVGLM